MRVATQDDVREFSNQLSAYEAEWEEIIAIVGGARQPRYSVSRIEEDSKFALAMIRQLPGLVKQ